MNCERRCAAERALWAIRDIRGGTQRLTLVYLVGGISLALVACGPPATAPRPSAATLAAPPRATPSSAPAADHGDHSAHAASSIATPQPTDHAMPALSSLARSSTAPASVTKLSGSGESNSGPFQLEQGLAAFHFGHSTDTPFGTFLLNAAGEHLALLANGTVVTGTQIYGVQAPGSHSLHVLATDAWSVDVELLTSIGAAADLPARLDGHGAAVTAPLALPAGQILVRWTHGGILPATLTGWSSDGQQRLDLMANQQSPEASTTLTVEAAGVYLFNVLADGAWTLAIEPQ